MQFHLSRKDYRKFRSNGKRSRFTANQKSYLTTKFKLGEQTGSKADPAAVARSMMCAKDATGDRLFSSDEFLTTTQIAGFFSHLASKKTLENDDQEGVEVAAHEACLERIQSLCQECACQQ